MTLLLLGLSSLCEVVIFPRLSEKNGGKQCNEQMLTATLTGTSDRYQHSDIATSIRLQKHTDILTVYKEYGMIMEEPLVN